MINDNFNYSKEEWDKKVKNYACKCHFEPRPFGTTCESCECDNENLKQVREKLSSKMFQKGFLEGREFENNRIKKSIETIKWNKLFKKDIMEYILQVLDNY
jgi:hypothetical protein